MDDLFYLNEALKEAKKALEKREVPIGAVIVNYNGDIIGRGHNIKESSKCATKHAEIVAIEAANRTVSDWRLNNSILYSTLEPCPMCSGAILQSRIKKVVYGAKDLKWGAVESKVTLFKEKLFNHTTETFYLKTDECSEILVSFFNDKRNKKKL